MYAFFKKTSFRFSQAGHTCLMVTMELDKKHDSSLSRYTVSSSKLQHAYQQIKKIRVKEGGEKLQQPNQLTY